MMQGMSDAASRRRGVRLVCAIAAAWLFTSGLHAAAEEPVAARAQDGRMYLASVTVEQEGLGDRRSLRAFVHAGGTSVTRSGETFPYVTSVSAPSDDGIVAVTTASLNVGWVAIFSVDASADPKLTVQLSNTELLGVDKVGGFLRPRSKTQNLVVNAPLSKEGHTVREHGLRVTARLVPFEQNISSR